MKTIALIIMLTNVTMGAVSVVKVGEFSSHETCQEAAKKIKRDLDGRMSYSCVEIK